MNSKLLAILVALTFTFFSCEDESVDIFENVSEETTVLSTAKSINSAALPQTIRELRNAGIAVSRRLARRVNGDLQTLLNAADQSSTKRGRRSLRRQGFTSNDIRELRRIDREYDALVDQINNPAPDPDPNPDPNPDPGTDPVLTAEQQAFVNRFSIPQDVLDELIARNSLDRIISREQTQLSNPANLVVLGNDLFEISVGINQGTGTTRVTRTRAQMEGTFSFQYLFDSLFDTRLQTPNTAETFDRMGREVFQALLDSL